MPIISPTAISPHRIGKNWSSYWATHSYAERVAHYFGDNLVALWSLDETTGDEAVATGRIPENNQIVPNSDLEGYTTGWSIGSATGGKTTTEGEFYSGAAAIKITSTIGIGYIQKSVSVIPGEKYTLRYWVKSDGTHNNAYKLLDKDYNVLLATVWTGKTAAEWAEVVSSEFTVPDNIYRVIIRIMTANAATTTLCVDAISFIPTSSVTARFLGGCYLNATLGQEGFRASEKSIYFDGTDGSGIALSSMIANNFPSTGSGTLLIWVKPTEGALTDGEVRSIVKFKTTSLSKEANYVDLFKAHNNNQFGMQFKDDTMSEKTIYWTDSSADWMCLIVTWSPGSGVRLFVNGVQEGKAGDISGSWTKIFDGLIMSIGSVSTYSPVYCWLGNLSHCALGDAMLSDEAITMLSQKFD